MSGPATLSELGGALATSQRNVSKHPGAPLQAGIVAREKRGNHAVFSIISLLAAIALGGGAPSG